MANLVLFAPFTITSRPASGIPRVSHSSRGLVWVRHRNADPPRMKPVAVSAGCRRRGWLFSWRERARVSVGPGASEAPPIAPRAAGPRSALFRF